MSENYSKYRKYGFFVVGMAILAFGLYNVHSRCAISEGGVLGATLLVRYWFGISPSITSLVLDTTLFVIGTILLGKGFLKDSLCCSLLFSFWYRIFEMTGPMIPDLSEYPLIAAILGGCFVGVGCGCVVCYDAAAGGDDALSLIMNKYFGLSIAHCYNITDGIVLLLSLSYIPYNQIVYSLLSVIISSNIVQLLYNSRQKTPVSAYKKEKVLQRN